MKTFKYIFISIMAFFSLAACVDNVPDIEDFPSDKVAFTYNVVGDYAIDYLVGSTIQFNNTSFEKGAVTWDFGDGSPVVTQENPTHIYQNAGKYTVTLTVDGVGKRTEQIMISDIFPTITLQPIPGGFAEIKTTPINLDVFIPNPQGLPVEYTWIFPDGTLDANKNPISTSSSQDPGTLYFNNVGSQQVVLRTTLGGRPLEEGVINVQVGYNQPAKTIYYAVKGGNIMAYKLVPNKPADVNISPFDLGVKSGQHPMNILFHESSLYVLDAGKQFTYVNDVSGVLGDGRIFVVSKDGTQVEVMISNVGGPAFIDPFYGYIDGTTRMLYFSDRVTGISRIGLDTRNAVIEKSSDNNRADYWVKNTTLAYYGSYYQFGALNSGFAKVGDTWWWGKYLQGVGIFRFKESDFNTGVVPPSGIAIPNVFTKSFVVDQQRNKVYFAVVDKGFYAATLAQFNAIASMNDIAPYLVAPMVSLLEGSSSEPLDICQMALDPEDGSVYFGYRKDPASTVMSGLKRYNPTTNKVESVIDNVEIYGVAINHTKAKLF